MDELLKPGPGGKCIMMSSTADRFKNAMNKFFLRNKPLHMRAIKIENVSLA